MRSAILAGGAARRFDGQPKGLVEIGGTRIIDRVASALRDVTSTDPAVIVGDPGQLKLVSDFDATVDTIPGAGTLGGIYTAVSLGDDHVLVVAWDMPFLSRGLLEELCNVGPEHDAVLPESTGRRGVEPLCAVYGPRCAAPIRDQLHSDDLRAIGFHNRIDLGTIPLGKVRSFGDPDKMFFNVNSSSDLQLAEEMWRKLE